jgi:hypothetical protein
MASRENLHKKNHAKLRRKTVPEHVVHKLVRHRSPHEVTSCFNKRFDASKKRIWFLPDRAMQGEPYIVLLKRTNAAHFRRQSLMIVTISGSSRTILKIFSSTPLKPNLSGGGYNQTDKEFI